MSVDLVKEKLNSSLSSSAVDIINRQFANTTRTSFIDSVEITSLEFGIYSSECRANRPVRHLLWLSGRWWQARRRSGSSEGHRGRGRRSWIERNSRRAAGRAGDSGFAYHHLFLHVQYERSPFMDLFSSTPDFNLQPSILNRGIVPPIPSNYRQATYPARPPSFYQNPVPSIPFLTLLNSVFHLQRGSQLKVLCIIELHVTSRRETNTIAQ